MAMFEATRQLGSSEATFFRWCKEYGGMSGDQLSRLKQLEKENQRLRRGCRPDTEQADSDRGGPGKLLSPAQRRQCTERVPQPARYF